MQTILKKYLQEISKYPLLSAKEEIELSQRFKEDNDKEAKNKLIESNLRLVVSIAKKYSENSSQSLMDLIQEGNLGLDMAVNNYDANKGYRFSTYAVYWIKQSIIQYLNNNSRTIRIPTHALNNLKTINEAKTFLNNKLGHEPSFKELADYLGEDEKDLQNLLTVYKNPLSLDYTISDDCDNDLKDLIVDENCTDPHDYAFNSFRKEGLLKILETLPEKEKDVIVYRYGIDNGQSKTLEEVGELVGLTRERVRQLELLAIRKLRSPLRTGALWELL